jgi:hypothetical protein
MTIAKFYKCLILCLLLVSMTYQYDTMFRLPLNSEIKFDREIVKNPIRIYLQIFRWLFSLTGIGHDLYPDSLNANLNVNSAVSTSTNLLSGATVIPSRKSATLSQPNSVKLYFSSSAVPIQPVYLSSIDYGIPTNAFSTQVGKILTYREMYTISALRLVLGAYPQTAH